MGAVIGSLVMLVAIVLVVNWIVHLSMNIGDGKTIGWGSIRDFKREFSKYEWSDDDWHESGLNLWNRANDCKYYASQIQFNDIRMIMITPWDLLLTRSHVRKYMKANGIAISKKKKMHKWS